MLTRKDLELYKKTTKTYELIFTKNGTVIDITGWTIYFTVKLNMKDTDANAKISKDIITHDNPTNGTTTINLTSDDTDIVSRSYYYDIKYKDDDGNIDVLIAGRLRIVEPVTERIS